MDTRIMVSYLVECGFNDIGDRDVDKDIYAYDEVESIEKGLFVISNNQSDGCGTIIEESKNIHGIWNYDVEHHVDHGTIYDETSY